MLTVQGKPFKAGGGAYACGWTASSSQPSKSMFGPALSMAPHSPHQAAPGRRRLSRGPGWRRPRP